jgi:hypothetical protein
LTTIRTLELLSCRISQTSLNAPLDVEQYAKKVVYVEGSIESMGNIYEYNDLLGVQGKVE